MEITYDWGDVMEYTVQDVFNKFGDKYLEMYPTSYNRLNVFNNIKTCRTKEQGIRIYKCSDCGKKVYTYKSCMDRHCPTCLEYKKEVWIEKHKEDILDIKYYHIVLCIPRELQPIFYYNQKLMYDLFFKVSSDSIIDCCYEALGINVGVTSILHTWSQKGKYFPHIHMLVTGGGVDKLGKWVDSELVDKEMIRTRFKNRLMNSIRRMKLDFFGAYAYLSNYDEFMKYLDKIDDDGFICYKKEPYNTVNDIYEYFGKYAFRVCITNDRIKNMDDHYVYFTYKTYDDKNKEGISRVKGEEFIRRFLSHTLDKSFVKIRYYGIMSCKNKKNKMDKLRILTRTKKNVNKFLDKIEILKKILMGRDITKCPKCNGKLYLYKEVYDNKGPPGKKYNFTKG